MTDPKTLQIIQTVTAIAIKSDGTPYSIQGQGWLDAAEQIIDADERQNEDIRRGITKTRFVKVFLSHDNKLEEHTIESLRTDVALMEIPDGPFETITWGE